MIKGVWQNIKYEYTSMKLPTHGSTLARRTMMAL